MMGYGDDLISTSIVKKAHAKTGRLVMVGDGINIHWSPLFDGNPKMTQEISAEATWVRSWPGGRPYVDRLYSTASHMAFNPAFRAEPGEIYLTDEERDWPDRGFVYIEPNVKTEVFGENKQWGFERWQQVVGRLPAVRFVQGIGRRLEGVEQRPTSSFRHACGLLSHANLFVGQSGGLHHASAALGVRAVIVWGGVDAPLNMGYDSHVNLHAGGKACGSFKPCAHCRRELDKISVDDVVKAIESALQSRH